MITDDQFTSVPEVLLKLQPIVPISDQYLYRGQGTDYSLIPSSLRERDMMVKLLPLILDTDIEKERYDKLTDQVKQNYIEFRIINRFVHLADEAGVSLPGDDSLFRQQLKSLRECSDTDQINIMFQKWPEHSTPKSSWNAVFALAQHYGLPTRYLDWTSYSYVALYFAASGAIEHNKKAEKDSTIMKTEDFFVYKLDTKIMEKAKVIIYPIQGSLNPNLSAQKGKHTFLDNTDDAVQKKGYENVLGVLNAITQYKIPMRYAVDVLEHLKAHNVSKDVLFPSLRSIVESMYERAYYLENEDKIQGV